MSKPYLLSPGGTVAYLGQLFRQIGIRDLLWLTLVIALWFGWGVDRDVEYQNYERRVRQQIIDLNAEVERLEKRNALLENALEKCIQSKTLPNQESD